VVVCLSPGGPDVYQASHRMERIFVATADGVVTLTRSGPASAWTIVCSALHGRHVSSLTWEPSRGALFAGTYGDGVHVSTDGGTNWTRASAGLTSDNVFALLAVGGGVDVTLYAGTEPAQLFISSDYGCTWQESSGLRAVPGTEDWTFPAPPHKAHVKHIVAVPRHPETLFVCVEQGALLRSDDGARTWRELSQYYSPEDHVFYKDCHRLAINQRNPHRMYMTGGDGTYRSSDGGETWQRLTDANRVVGYPDAMVLSPENDRVVFVAGARTGPAEWRKSHMADGVIACSRDDGASWQALRGGLPASMHGAVEALSLLAWPTGFGLVAGTTDGEVYTSEDRGETWTLIASDLAPISKGDHYLLLRRDPVA
jgi:photosystem II stability/assembly factor-like uncharacterized protein